MKPCKSLPTALILLYLVCSGPHALCQSGKGRAVNAREAERVSFCEMMRNPEQYYGKKVRIRARWCRGFERSYLYGRACNDIGSHAWTRLAIADEDRASRKLLDRLIKARNRSFTSRADVTVVGELQEGRFGHMNAYRYLFVISSIEEAKPTPGYHLCD